MVRKYSSFLAILALSFIASSASATDMAQTTAGGPVTITLTAGLIPGGTDVSFQPSAQVFMDGTSETTAFAAISGHAAVAGREAGQNYGMASDTANVFWLAAPETFPACAETNSAYFNDNNWNRN